jgi:hypothetical protein
MNDEILKIYVTELLDGVFKDLIEKFPMAPLGAVKSNYLDMPFDGSGASRLHELSGRLVNQIRLLEPIPDSECVEEVKDIADMDLDMMKAMVDSTNAADKMQLITDIQGAKIAKMVENAVPSESYNPPIHMDVV